jgi:hypothetical protein
MLAGILVAGLLLTSWLFRGLGTQLSPTITQSNRILDAQYSCHRSQTDSVHTAASKSAWGMLFTGYLRSKKQAKAGHPAAASVLAKEQRRKSGLGKRSRRAAKEDTTAETASKAPLAAEAHSKLEDM